MNMHFEFCKKATKTRRVAGPFCIQERTYKNISDMMRAIKQLKRLHGPYMTNCWQNGYDQDGRPKVYIAREWTASELGFPGKFAVLYAHYDPAGDCYTLKTADGTIPTYQYQSPNKTIGDNGLVTVSLDNIPTWYDVRVKGLALAHEVKLVY